jgi:hypothetical protein
MLHIRPPDGEKNFISAKKLTEWACGCKKNFIQSKILTAISFWPVRSGGKGHQADRVAPGADGRRAGVSARGTMRFPLSFPPRWRSLPPSPRDIAMSDLSNPYKAFVAAGIPEPHARVIVHAIHTSSEHASKDLATKADLHALRSELQTEMQDVRTGRQSIRTDVQLEIQEVLAGFRGELASTKQEVVKWIIGSMLVAVLTGILT